MVKRWEVKQTYGYQGGKGGGINWEKMGLNFLPQKGSVPEVLRQH